MNKETNNQILGLQIIGLTLPRIPLLFFKFGSWYLRFKGNVNNASKVFEKQLISNGIDKQMADELTKCYSSTANILNLKNFSKLSKIGGSINVPDAPRAKRR
jgi:hypothetical protein